MAIGLTVHSSKRPAADGLTLSLFSAWRDGIVCGRAADRERRGDDGGQNRADE
jgi:hypothetical protein